jgi:hypothetical protein
MKRILKFWISCMFMRLHVEEPAGGGGSLLSGGGTGGAPDWRADLPEDIRADPSLAAFKAKDHKEALGVIAKSYVHAQKLVGVDKMAKPTDKWTPEQWKGFYKELGVPETHDKYTLPDVKMADGLAVVPEKIDKFKKVFHEAGLTPKQVTAVMGAYLNDVNGEHTGRIEQSKAQMTAAENELKQELGDKYSAKVDIARSVLAKFGSDTLLEKLEKSGLANDPEVVRMFIKLGEGMLEDSAGGSGDGLLLQTATQATQEINALKGDKDFQTALNTKNHAGHKAAVEKWLKLHEQAAARKD